MQRAVYELSQHIGQIMAFGRGYLYLTPSFGSEPLNSVNVKK